MRRKHIWVWIVCLALVVCCLSVFFWLRNRESDETAKTSAPEESASASAIHSDTGSNESESASREGQTEPSAPDQATHKETKEDASAVAEPSADAKPPETESAPENTDIVIEDNGDVLLPEVP